jgi:hypothetical protein
MAQQIISEEFRRMQELAGLLTEEDKNSITLAINYNTDQDDLDYIAGILKKAGIAGKVKVGIYDEEVKIKINKADKDKLAKVLRKNGFELIDPTQIRSSYLDLEEDLTGNAKSLSTKKQLGKAQSNQLNEVNLMNMDEEWMESWRQDFEELTIIMEKYKNEDPVESFPNLVKELQAKYGQDKIKPSFKPKNAGLYYPFAWAIDNLGAYEKVPKDLYGPKALIYRGGPGDNWILRKWD